MEITENLYLLSHLVLISGLTDRTLRNYISSGILQGEKINGLWHFTPEQVEEFLTHPAVRPSILAKQNGAVYDFLGDTHKTTCEACMILDFPGKDRKELSEFFCYTITNGSYKNIRFSLDGVGKVPRVILKGDTQTVLSLINTYTQMHP